MTTPRNIRRVGDVSGLPTSAHGARHMVWWGNISFMLIEGSGFLLAVGAYFYLQSQSPHWPPAGDRLPDLGWSGVFLILLLLSQIPNLWVLKQARRRNVRGVRTGMALMTGIGFLLALARWFAMQHLNVRWDQDAYGSVVWMLMLLHTLHVVTELGEVAVIAVWLSTHQVGDDQFADVEDACDYWTFVVLSWLPLYVIIYWVPRWA